MFPVITRSPSTLAEHHTAEALTKWVVATQQGYEARLKAIMADDTLDDEAKVAAIQGIVVDFTLPDMGPEGASAPIAADPEA